MAQWYALVVGSVRLFVVPTYWAGHLVSFFNLDQGAWKTIVQGQVWPCPFTYISSTANYKGRVKRRAHRSKIFTTWPFSEKVCRPLTCTIESLSSRKYFMLFICKLRFLTFFVLFPLKNSYYLDVGPPDLIFSFSYTISMFYNYYQGNFLNLLLLMLFVLFF